VALGVQEQQKSSRKVRIRSWEKVNLGQPRDGYKFSQNDITFCFTKSVVKAVMLVKRPQQAAWTKLKYNVQQNKTEVQCATEQN
jgi:ribosomal protein L24E